MRGQKGKPSVKSLNILSLIAESFKIILFWLLHQIRLLRRILWVL